MKIDAEGHKFKEGTIQEGRVRWKSPSNIALVKYWGKYGEQLPKNPSISFTLDKAHTITQIDYRPKLDDGKLDINFFFEGKPNEAFGQKIEQFLVRQINLIPWVTQLQMTIKSENSFPHSSGIASSASGMSALVMCLLDIESKHKGVEISLAKASYISRLASGSASRSLFPDLAIWGSHNAIKGSSNLYAIPYGEEVNPMFKTFHDDILIISGKEKSVSSTAGHALMNGNIYAENRYMQANQNLMDIIRSMKEGDLEKFGAIVESEALTLHALMMCSTPSYMLMEPHTISVINEIRQYRKESKHPIYFTLDAGPNIHLLYPDNIAEQVSPFIKEVLQPYCVGGKMIYDKVGKGPQKLTHE